MHPSVGETGRNGELKWWKAARYEGCYEWVTIHQWLVRKPVSPHFKLQKSLNSLSVTKQHKLEPSQWFDRKAGKLRVILVTVEEWSGGLTYSALHVVGSSLKLMTLHPFLKLYFAVSLQSQNMIFFFSLWKSNMEDPKYISPGISPSIS